MNLNELPRYRTFVEQRDKAIEALFNRAMDEANDLLRGTLSAAVLAMIGQYEATLKDPNPANAIKGMNQVLDGMFSQLANSLAAIESRMMLHVEMLSTVGGAEAIARATGKRARVEYRKGRPKVNQAFEPLAGRARVAVHKIQMELIGAFQTSVWLIEDLEQFKARLIRALPKKRIYRRPPRILKPLREAEDDTLPLGSEAFATPAGPVRMSQAIMDEEEWNELVSHVLDRYVPAMRGPEAILDPGEKVTIDVLQKTFETQTERYAWEFEQDAAHELVRQTINGENEAARQNGVTSFVWVAIVDDKTDDCCLWRDGLTVEEIADALQNERSDDDCQAFAPPAHFNCRCRLAPVIDAKDLEPPPSNLPEFEEWLTLI